jgi:hypothetical protein
VSEKKRQLVSGVDVEERLSDEEKILKHWRSQVFYHLTLSDSRSTFRSYWTTPSTERAVRASRGGAVSYFVSRLRNEDPAGIVEGSVLFHEDGNGYCHVVREDAVEYGSHGEVIGAWSECNLEDETPEKIEVRSVPPEKDDG